MAAIRHLGNWRLNGVACNADQRKLSVYFGVRKFIFDINFMIQPRYD